LHWSDDLKSTIQTWDQRAFVISPDIDGLISGSMLQFRFPEARCIGSYDSKQILYFDGATSHEIKKALWVDLDVIHPDILCVGQHLLLHDAADELPTRNSLSFNPNMHFVQDHPSSFHGSAPGRDKYPFATVHLLRETLGVDLPSQDSLGWAALAHADGSWSTSVQYVKNCRIWADAMFSDDPFIENLISEYTTTDKAFSLHEELVVELRNLGVQTSTSASSAARAESRWDSLRGHQALRAFEMENPSKWMHHLREVSSFLGNHLGLHGLKPEKLTGKFAGTVLVKNPFQIPAGAFDTFCREESVFSHAIVSKRAIRYTKNLTGSFKA